MEASHPPGGVPNNCNTRKGISRKKIRLMKIIVLFFLYAFSYSESYDGMVTGVCYFIGLR